MNKELTSELAVNDEYTKYLIICKDLIQSNLLDESSFDLCHQWLQKLNKCKIDEKITRNYFLELLCSQLKTGRLSLPFTNLQNINKPLFKIVMKNKFCDFLSEIDVEEKVSNIGDTEKNNVLIQDEDSSPNYKKEFEDLLNFFNEEKLKFSIELSEMKKIKTTYENFYENNILDALKNISIEPDFSKIINSDFLTKMFEQFPNQNIQEELQEIESQIKNNFENWVNVTVQREHKIATEIYKNKSEELLEEKTNIFEARFEAKLDPILQKRSSIPNNSIGTQTSIDSYSCDKIINKKIFKKMQAFFEHKFNELKKQKILEDKANQISLAAEKVEIFLELETKHQQDFDKFTATLKDEIYDVMKTIYQNEKNI